MSDFPPQPNPGDLARLPDLNRRVKDFAIEVSNVMAIGMKKYFGVLYDPDTYNEMVAGMEGMFMLILQKFDRGELHY